MCCRVVLWTLLFLIALFDSVRHRHIKRKGCQLQRGIVLSLFAYVVQDVLLLSYSVLDNNNSKDTVPVRRAYYVFSDLADSIFMVLHSTSVTTCDQAGRWAEKVLMGVDMTLFLY